MSTKRFFHLHYRDAIPPIGKIKTFEGLYESEYTARQDFNNQFANKLNSKGIDQHQLINCKGFDLPDLTQSEMQTACECFPEEQNPIEEMQVMKLRKGLK